MQPDERKIIVDADDKRYNGMPPRHTHSFEQREIMLRPCVYGPPIPFEPEKDEVPPRHAYPLDPRKIVPPCVYGPPIPFKHEKKSFLSKLKSIFCIKRKNRG